MKKPESLQKVFVIATQHLDVAWLWKRSPHGEALMKEVFERSLELVSHNPDAKFVMSRSTAWGYYIIEKKYPKLFEKVKKAVAQGSIELSGGQWVEPDNAAPSGESFVRQGLYGQMYYYTRFGKIAKVAWNPDVFMHGNTLPQILLKTGLEGYYFHRCRPEDENGDLLYQFIWEGPDGSKVYCFTANWYNRPDEKVMDMLCESTQQQALPADYMVTGLMSDRRITIEPDWMIYPEKLKKEYGLDECKWAGSDEMLAEMKSYTDKLPVVKGDLGGYLFTGTYTSDSITKGFNRRLENGLAASEFINSWNHMNGGVYYYALLTEGWRNLCVNQFHDILCGTCYKAVQEEAHKLFLEIEEKKNLSLDSAQEELQMDIKTNHQEGVPYIIYNPSSSDRQDAVEINLDDGMPVEIYSSKGEKIPSQVIERNGGKKVIFIPLNPVPGYGFTVVYFRASSSYVMEHDSELVLENDEVRVEFDGVYGTIASFYSKKLGIEFFEKGKRNNRLGFYEDKNEYEHSPDHRWDPWFIKYTGKKHDPHGAYRVHVLESGPICKTIRVERILSLTPNYPDTEVYQDITLYRNSPMLYIRTHGNWYAEQALLKAEFDFSFEAPEIACDMPYGVMERESDFHTETTVGLEAAEDQVKRGSKRDEPHRPMQMWIDFSDGQKGMAVFNNGKYGYDSTARSIGLSLMRAPFIRQGEVAGLGPFEFSYALYPHEGTWKEANLPAKGYCFNRNFIVKQTWSHDGSLTTGSSLFTSDSPSVMITAVKRAELSNDIIVRLYESKGERTDIRFTSLYPIADACEIDAIELNPQKSGIILKNAHELSFAMGAFELKTLRLSMK